MKQKEKSFWRGSNLTVEEHQLKYFLPLGANYSATFENFAAFW
jgi:hypothetical protein